MNPSIPPEDAGLYKSLLDKVEDLEARVKALEDTSLSLAPTVFALERQVIQIRCSTLANVAISDVRHAYRNIQFPPTTPQGTVDLTAYNQAMARQQHYRTVIAHIDATFNVLSGKLSNAENPLAEGRIWYSNLYDYLGKNGFPNIFAKLGNEGFVLMIAEE